MSMITSFENILKEGTRCPRDDLVFLHLVPKFTDQGDIEELFDVFIAL